MKCAVKINSGAMIYIRSFIKSGRGIQNYRTGTQHGDCISVFQFFFFKIREVG
jgi:hypothetical protein